MTFRRYKFPLCIILLSGLLCAAFYCRSIWLLLVSLSLSCFFVAPVCKRSANYLLVFGSIAFATGIGELIIDSFFKNSTYFSPNHYSSYNSREYIFGSIPGKGIHKAGKKSGNRVIYDAIYTIGEDGFRVTALDSISAPASRTNFFGGSFTFGEGLNDNETLPYYFSQLSKQADVKNYGMHGWGVSNALALLENKKIDGSVNILLTAPWHAVRAFCVHDWAASHPSYTLKENGEVELQGKCRDYADKSKVGALLDRVLAYSSIYSLISAGPGKPVITQEMLTLYLALIENINIESAKNDQKLVVAYISDESYRFENAVTNADIFQRLSTIADAVVDVTLAADIAQLNKKYVIDELDRHPSALANSERAKILVTAVNDYVL